MRAPAAAARGLRLAAAVAVGCRAVAGWCRRRAPGAGAAPRRSAAAAAAAAAAISEGGWLVVGLGNPGREYERTRHNIGFRVVDQLAAAEGITLRASRKHQGHVGTGRLRLASGDGPPVVLLKPSTYMNLSGHSVQSVMAYYKIPQDRLLVVVDDLDTPLGSVRLKPKGSAGGHNGLKSIAQCLGGSNAYARLKCGIGRPENGNVPVVDYVLQRFSKGEEASVDDILRRACEVARACVTNGLQAAMNAANAPKKGAAKAGNGKKAKRVDKPS